MTESRPIPPPNRQGRFAGHHYREWAPGAHPDGVIAEEYDPDTGRTTFRLWYDGRSETYPYPEPANA